MQQRPSRQRLSSNADVAGVILDLVVRQGGDSGR
jgi:hypothetical protein